MERTLLGEMGKGRIFVLRKNYDRGYDDQVADKLTKSCSLRFTSISKHLGRVKARTTLTPFRQAKGYLAET